MSAYEVLGLVPSLAVTNSDITARYRKLAKLHHPDVGGQHETFVKIVRAYEALKDPHTRLQIDIQCGLVIEEVLSSDEEVVIEESDDDDAYEQPKGKKRKRSRKRRKERKKELKKKRKQRE